MSRRFRDPYSGITYASFTKLIKAPNVIAMHDLIVAAGPRGDDVLIGRVMGRTVDHWRTVDGKTQLEKYSDDCTVLAVLAVCARRSEEPLGLTSMQLYDVDVRDVVRVLESDNPALLWLLNGKMPSMGEALRALKYGALGNSYIGKYLSDSERPASAALCFDKVRNEARKALRNLAAAARPRPATKTRGKAERKTK